MDNDEKKAGVDKANEQLDRMQPESYEQQTINIAKLREAQTQATASTIGKKLFTLINAIDPIKPEKAEEKEAAITTLCYGALTILQDLVPFVTADVINTIERYDAYKKHSASKGAVAEKSTPESIANEKKAN